MLLPQASSQLRSFGKHVALVDATAFAEWLALLRNGERVVYAKRPFARPVVVLTYLSRYHPRVAIPTSCSSS